MKRIHLPPRNDWHRSISEQGMLWHTADDPYWSEGTAYEFSMGEIEFIEDATAELYDMCIAAAQHLMTAYSDTQLALPDGSLSRMQESFNKHRNDTIYARFDLAFNPMTDTLKMYELNGDTPTMLVESAVAQWHWKQDVYGETRDQFNSIHERLIRGWRRLAAQHHTSHISFVGCLDLIEEGATLAYLADCAEQAGLTTSLISIDDVGLDEAGQFINDTDNVLGLTFKLYPTEDMLRSPFGNQMERNTTTFIEPLWKQALSHKALLAALWDMYPNHPYLLPASLDESRVPNPLPKPFFGREGAGMHPSDSVNPEATCYQTWHELPLFDGYYPVIGSWIIDGHPAGMGIRETSQPITDVNASFVPHVITSPAPSEEQSNEWLKQG